MEKLTTRTSHASLQLLALNLNDESLRDTKVFALPLPIKWREFLRDINPPSSHKLSTVVSGLTNKLSSIFPEIVWVNMRAHLGDGSVWILATRPIPLNLLIPLCQEWFQQTAKQKHKTLSAEPSIEAVEWVEIKISDVVDSWNQYRIIPSLVANKFSNTAKEIVWGTNAQLPETLHFYQVHSDSYAECISDPIPRRVGKDTAYFSYVIRFSLQNRGGQSSRSLLFVSFGIRRFVTEPIIKNGTNYMKSVTKGSVLISMAHPFVQTNDVDSKAYARLSICRKGSHTEWETGADRFFGAVLWGDEFSPEDLLTDPMKYLHTDAHAQALIVHNHLYGNHRIAAGIGLLEKETLFQLVCDEFPEWKPLDSAPMLRNGKPKPLRRTDYTFVSRPQKLKVEVWGPRELYDSVIEVFESAQYRNSPFAERLDECTYRLRSNNPVTVALDWKSDTEYFGDLNTVQYRDKAFGHRVQLIAHNLDSEKGGTRVLSLVQVRHKDDYESEQDPKQAIREGFRLTGRVTQFVNPELHRNLDIRETSNFPYRVRKAVFDLLSDSGIVDKRAGLWPDDVNLLAFDILRVRRKSTTKDQQERVEYVPFFTKWLGGELFATGLGTGEWIHLSDALTRIDRFETWTRKDWTAVTQLLDQVLMPELQTHLLTYLLINADLRRGFLSGLQNTRLEVEQVPEITHWMSQQSNLRVIRINSAEDVPAYIFNPLSYSSGVFKDSSSTIYYGIGQKPPTDKFAKSSTKYGYPTTSFRQGRNVEYIPMGFADEDERDHAVWMIHDMRNWNVTYDVHTRLPYPMHMMRSLAKYINQVSYESQVDTLEFIDEDIDVYDLGDEE